MLDIPDPRDSLRSQISPAGPQDIYIQIFRVQPFLDLAENHEKRRRMFILCNILILDAGDVEIRVCHLVKYVAQSLLTVRGLVELVAALLWTIIGRGG